MTSSSQKSQTAAPITFDDVKHALGETDPNSTNANAIRAVLGRGSFGTIQKHLDSIRAERAPVLPTSDCAVPPAPAELIHAIWSTAWNQANVATLGRLEHLTVQRDAKILELATTSSDLNVAAENIDSLNEQLTGAVAQNTVMEQAVQQAMIIAETEVSRLVTALNLAKTEIERLKADIVHDSELSFLQAKLKDQAHANAVNHLTDELANVKSLLIARATLTVIS
jgi:hypothetical protein